jgi:hypothetical protein
MPTFIVERYLPGAALEELRAGISRCRLVAAEMRSEGRHVRHVGSVFVAEDELCLCTFTAPAPEIVAEVNRRADFAYAQISRAETIETSPRTRRTDPRKREGRHDK